MGISSCGGWLWSTDKDYRKLVPILAHGVNSVSGLALDFGLDHLQLVNCWGPYILYVKRGGADILLGPVLCMCTLEL